MAIGDRHRPLRDVVCDEIRARIIRGEHAPGEHLVEDRLATELGVSRNPVREALRVLEAEGFVQMIPRKGALVATLSDDEVRDIFEVRIALEGLAARLAARHADESDVSGLLEAIDDAEDALRSGDQGALVELNSRYHEGILDLSGNGYLHEVMMRLRGRTQWIFSRTAGSIRGQHSLKEHRELADAIRSGDEELAARLAREHVEAAAESYWAARAADPETSLVG